MDRRKLGKYGMTMSREQCIAIFYSNVNIAPDFFYRVSFLWQPFHQKINYSDAVRTLAGTWNMLGGICYHQL